VVEFDVITMDGLVTLVVNVGAVELSDVAHADPVDTAIPAPGYTMPVEATVMLPAVLVIVIFAPAVRVEDVYPVPFPIRRAPLAGVVAMPVPPLATATVPVIVEALTASGVVCLT
jgi:hypothetical protein